MHRQIHLFPGISENITADQSWMMMIEEIAEHVHLSAGDIRAKRRSCPPYDRTHVCRSGRNGNWYPDCWAPPGCLYPLGSPEFYRWRRNAGGLVPKVLGRTGVPARRSCGPGPPGCAPRWPKLPLAPSPGPPRRSASNAETCYLIKKQTLYDLKRKCIDLIKLIDEEEIDWMVNTYVIPLNHNWNNL